MKFKNRIMMIITLSVLSISIFCQELYVHAASTVFDYSYSRGYLLPVTYCGTDSTVTANYEESFYINTYADGNNGLVMDSAVYYFILATGGISISNEESEKSVTSCSVDPYGYFLYAGEKYFLSQDGIGSFLVSGNDYNGFSFYLGANVSVSPYHSNGYYYANSYRCRLNQSQRLRIMQMNFNEVASEVTLYTLNQKMETLISIMSSHSAMTETYISKLTDILLRLTYIDLDMDSLISLMDTLIVQMQDANLELDSIDVRLDTISKTLDSFYNDMVNQTNSDKNKTDAFASDSSSQSSELDNLNQQTQPDKIDVDSASGSVDQNLDLDVDANYGVLLSTFTNNGTILKMMLAVASMGLISYVLFGKR